MSRSDTGEAQRKRLAELGLSVAELPALSDVDTVDDLLTVAAEAPGSRFAVVVQILVREGAVS